MWSNNVKKYIPPNKKNRLNGKVLESRKDQNIQATKHGHWCVTENKNIQSEFTRRYVRVIEMTVNGQPTF